jgi:hypothetical protein
MYTGRIQKTNLMIEIPSLTETDRGRWVRYLPSGATLPGCILRWDEHHIYVVWNCNGQWRHFDSGDYVVSAMSPEDLEFFDSKAASSSSSRTNAKPSITDIVPTRSPLRKRSA